MRVAWAGGDEARGRPDAAGAPAAGPAGRTGVRTPRARQLRPGPGLWAGVPRDERRGPALLSGRIVSPHDFPAHRELDGFLPLEKHLRRCDIPVSLGA